MPHTHDDNRWFPHERLDAYKLALEALQFVAARKPKLTGLTGGMGQQLERAVAGTFSNICSAAAAFGAESRRQFKTALSEAGEAGGCAEGVFALGGLTTDEHARLRSTLLRLCACLRGLAT